MDTSTFVIISLLKRLEYDLYSYQGKLLHDQNKLRRNKLNNKGMYQICNKQMLNIGSQFKRQPNSHKL